jgi:hypothetical protein
MPYGLDIDGIKEQVFVADTGNHAVRVIDLAAGTLSTVAGVLASPGHMGDGEPATSAQLYFPFGVAVNSAARHVYIADNWNHAVRLLNLVTGTLTTVVGKLGMYGRSGDGGRATLAQLHSPMGLAVDASHRRVYISDASNHIVRRLAVANDVRGVPVDVTYQTTCSSYACSTPGWAKKNNVNNVTNPDESVCCEPFVTQVIPGYTFSHNGYWPEYTTGSGKTLQACADECSSQNDCIAVFRAQRSGDCYTVNSLDHAVHNVWYAAYTKDGVVHPGDTMDVNITSMPTCSSYICSTPGWVRKEGADTVTNPSEASCCEPALYSWPLVLGCDTQSNGTCDIGVWCEEPDIASPSTWQECADLCASDGACVQFAYRHSGNSYCRLCTSSSLISNGDGNQFPWGIYRQSIAGVSVSFLVQNMSYAVLANSSPNSRYR